MKIFLYGPPGAGKTTLGKRLAEALKVEFFDLDALIVEAAGKPIREIFETNGEAAFRDLESKLLNEFCGKTASVQPQAFVMALGGGTLLREANRQLCEREGIVLCLEAPDADELQRRLTVGGKVRPLGDKSVERAAHYASFPHRIAASFDLENSLVLVGSNFAPVFLRDYPTVADANVERLYAEKLPRRIATVPSGEEHKTIATVASLWTAFAKAGLGRKNVVAAVGGGVTGDLTGFAAATFMRGIDWINVPTTLLAMVDASTGGKTGCDLPEGKNLAGAFHSPRLVAIDTDFLKTLPPAILSEGRAEMIKHAFIGGRSALVEGEGKLSPKAIAANLAVKIRIVREDPFERKGLRILLNCGHTVAHAVEKLSNYTLSHGKAVAIGCVAEARLAAERGLAAADWPQTVAAAFAAEGLPTEIPEAMRDWKLLAPVMRGDKKRDGDSVVFALPCGWGDTRGVEIDFNK